MPRSAPVRPLLALATLALALPVAAPQVLPSASAAPQPTTSAGPWSALASAPETSAGAARSVRPERFSRWTLDRGAYLSALRAARGTARTTVALPGPDGDMVRFTVTSSTVMEAGLAAAHPEIGTWTGRGVDDPAASVRMDLGPLGLHASVRTPTGAWYVDPYYQRDRGVYLSYWGRDLRTSPHGAFVERDGDAVAQAEEVLGAASPDVDELDPSGAPAPDGGPRIGSVLRTFRLALVNDPSYAQYFGTENVTAAKVALVNRVDQVYEDDLAVRLVLIDATDRLNLDTAARATGTDGPCGPEACYSDISLQFCSHEAIYRNATVLGRLVGAGAYDVGHLTLGNNGGGIAGVGVVGGVNKAVGCTGLAEPVGDAYAVDYVAHELGHQFGGNHTFNGVDMQCSGANRHPGTSVEPGSGSSVMGYAGICLRDDLQPHTDPYFSQRSQQEIDRTVTQLRRPLADIQTVGLTQFDGADSFALAFRGERTRTITRGVDYSREGISAALRDLPSVPDDAVIDVTRFGGPRPSIGDTGFRVAFRGSLGGTEQPDLRVVEGRGTTGSVGRTQQGGPSGNRGAVSPTGNTPPVVTTPAQLVVPVRTPFALTGSATDADGDVLTYLWEQNDPGGRKGTALIDPDKREGPLFRQFGTPVNTDVYEPGAYGSRGENHATTDPSRVFPNLRQVLRGNTNAATGDCVGPRVGPVGQVPARLRECYAEFLPTQAYRGLGGDAALHFRLTARDRHPGGGGVASSDTTLRLARSAGPFLVTSPGAGQSYRAGSVQTVRWDVAGTAAAPVGVSSVRITMSTDAGRTWTHVLAAATANDGAAQVTVPGGATDAARVRVEAVGNVFFAVNAGDFSVTP